MLDLNYVELSTLMIALSDAIYQNPDNELLRNLFFKLERERKKNADSN